MTSAPWNIAPLYHMGTTALFGATPDKLIGLVAHFENGSTLLV